MSLLFCSLVSSPCFHFIQSITGWYRARTLMFVSTLHRWFHKIMKYLLILHFAAEISLSITPACAACKPSLYVCYYCLNSQFCVVEESFLGKELGVIQGGHKRWSRVKLSQMRQHCIWEPFTGNEKGVVLLLRKGREDEGGKKMQEDMGCTWGSEVKDKWGVTIQKGQDTKAPLVRAKVKPQHPKIPKILCCSYFYNRWTHPKSSWPGSRLHWNPFVENLRTSSIHPWCSPAGSLSHVRYEMCARQSLPRARACSHPLLDASCPRHTCIPLLPAPHKGCWPLTSKCQHQNDPNSPGVTGEPHPNSFSNPPVPGKGEPGF